MTPLASRLHCTPVRPPREALATCGRPPGSDLHASLLRITFWCQRGPSLGQVLTTLSSAPPRMHSSAPPYPPQLTAQGAQAVHWLGSLRDRGAKLTWTRGECLWVGLCSLFSAWGGGGNGGPLGLLVCPGLSWRQELPTPRAWCCCLPITSHSNLLLFCFLSCGLLLAFADGNEK